MTRLFIHLTFYEEKKKLPFSDIIEVYQVEK